MILLLQVSVRSGQRVGSFREDESKSYGGCEPAGKVISFDLPYYEALDYGQVYLTFKNRLKDSVRVKIFGDRNEQYLH